MKITSLFICGDIVNLGCKNGFIGDNLKKVIKPANFAVCNLEGPEIKEQINASFPHQEPGTIQYLKDCGFDLMLLANNHITELGAEGIQYSVDVIKKTGADYIGAGLSWQETYHPLIKEINGLRFCFINVCEAQVGQFMSKDQSYGYAWMGYEGLYDEIKEMSKLSDRLVIFVHAGLEHYTIPLPEIRDFYRKLCDAGASAVIGGHTHAAQGLEYYEGKPIIYSLGNFYFPRSDGKWEGENISYSVLLNFVDEGDIEITPIHHSLRNGIVDIQSDINKIVDIEDLCEMLGEGYEKRANDMCIMAYRNLCSHLLAEATCGEYEGIGIVSYFKQKLCQIFMRRRYVKNTQARRDALMLRLFENESYRWTIVRALKIKNTINSLS